MNWHKFFSMCIACMVGFTINLHSSIAEDIRIPIGEQAKDQIPVDMPAKGMSKERVRNLFGEPLEDVPAKGKPPISRWKYKEFTVYFDGTAVIHCVRNFQPKVPPA